MTTAAIRLDRLAQGAETTVITPGVDDFVALVPLSEPISVGAPPIAPSVIIRASQALDLERRRVRSGPDVTFPLATTPRPRYAVEWHGLTQEENETLRDWIVGELEQTLRAFTIAPDEGEDVVVRMTEDSAEQWRNQSAWDRVSIECEEVST